MADFLLGYSCATKRLLFGKQMCSKNSCMYVKPAAEVAVRSIEHFKCYILGNFRTEETSFMRGHMSWRKWNKSSCPQYGT